MKIRRKVTTAILTAVMLLSPVMEISASSLSDAQKEKENLEKQLEEAQSVIDGLKDSKADIQTKVKELDQQLTSISLEITNTQAQLEEKSAEITDTQSELEDAQADVASQAEAMSKRIQFMYENSGKMSYLEAFFQSGSMAEFLNQAEYIRQISEYDRDMLQQYNDSVQTVADAEEQLEQEYTELEERKAYVHMNEEIANAVANLQLFGAVDGKNFTEMGDVTNTGAISKMVNNVVVQNADVDTELKTAQTAVEGLMK